MRGGMRRLFASLALGVLVLSGCSASETEPETSTYAGSAEPIIAEPMGAEIEEAFLLLALATSTAEKQTIYSEFGLDRDGFFPACCSAF